MPSFRFGRLALAATVSSMATSAPALSMRSRVLRRSASSELDKPHTWHSVADLLVLAVIVSGKYVTVMLRADTARRRQSCAVGAASAADARRFLGISCSARHLRVRLFYGDSMITPAISVLSAVEGLHVAVPALGEWVVPITLVILITLSCPAPRHGSSRCAVRPGDVAWFIVIGVLGLISIVRYPQVLAALDPPLRHRLLHGGRLGRVSCARLRRVAVTGAEALYADMGHFGRRPIRLAWFGLVLPCLLLNYFGQGAMLIETPAAIDSPFYRLAPEWALLPMCARHRSDDHCLPGPSSQAPSR